MHHTGQAAECPSANVRLAKQNSITKVLNNMPRYGLTKHSSPKPSKEVGKKHTTVAAKRKVISSIIDMLSPSEITHHINKLHSPYEIL